MEEARQKRVCLTRRLPRHAFRNLSLSAAIGPGLQAHPPQPGPLTGGLAARPVTDR